MEVNLNVMMNVNPDGLCLGWNNTLTRSVDNINKLNTILFFTDCRTIKNNHLPTIQKIS